MGLSISVKCPKIVFTSDCGLSFGDFIKGFCANACGACIRTRANTGKYSRGIIIFRILAKFLREFISVRIHVAPEFAPARIQEKFLANYLCIGFVPGGILFLCLGLFLDGPRRNISASVRDAIRSKWEPPRGGLGNPPRLPSSLKNVGTMF